MTRHAAEPEIARGEISRILVERSNNAADCRFAARIAGTEASRARLGAPALARAAAKAPLIERPAPRG